MHNIIITTKELFDTNIYKLVYLVSLYTYTHNNNLQVKKLIFMIKNYYKD